MVGKAPEEVIGFGDLNKTYQGIKLEGRLKQI